MIDFSWVFFSYFFMFFFIVFGKVIVADVVPPVFEPFGTDNVAVV